MPKKSNKQELVDSLAGVNLFNGLDDGQLGMLAEHFHKVREPAGTLLLEEGARGSALQIVLDGSVRVFLPADPENGGRPAEVQLATMGPGDLFAEYGFVDLRPASASVAAVEDCTLLQIDYHDLHRVLDEDSTLARSFYENLLLVLIDRLRASDQELDLFAGFEV